MRIRFMYEICEQGGMNVNGKEEKETISHEKKKLLGVYVFLILFSC